MPIILDRDEARRIAVRAQLLSADRPTELVPMVEQLTVLQIDPTAAVAPNADLIAYTRLGGAYRPAHLTAALEVDRTLFEQRAMIYPMSDLALYRGNRAASPYADSRWVRDWMDANEPFQRFVVELLDDSGPLLSRDVPDRAVVPWPSTGWTNNRNVTQMLEFLSVRGAVAVSARQGRQRIWDLAERVFPDTEVLSPPEQERRRDARRLRCLGITRPDVVGEAGEDAVVEGVVGSWRVDPAAVGQPFTGRTALLSPFDRLIHDRGRTQALFDFEYVLEMYKPKDKRRWGYFALPVLHHDRLVGKVDAVADRKAGIFRLNAIHPDVRFSKAMTADVREEVTELAGWLGLTLVG